MSVLIGYILALIYVLEADDLRAFWARVDPRSLNEAMAPCRMICSR